jgi:hypothetical protein
MNTNKILVTSAACAIGIGLNCSIEVSAEIPSNSQQTQLVVYSRPSFPSQIQKAAELQLQKTFRYSQQLEQQKFTRITFVVAEDGKIYEPTITHFSGSDQFDAECLEAVCGLYNLPAVNYGSFRLEGVGEVFGPGDGASIKPVNSAPEIAAFLKTHQLSKGEVVVHKIPLFVLSQYPGLFKFEELASPDNLMIIKRCPSYLDGVDDNLPIPFYISIIKRMNASWRICLANEKPLTRAYMLEMGDAMASPAYLDQL